MENTTHLFFITTLNEQLGQDCMEINQIKNNYTCIDNFESVKKRKIGILSQLRKEVIPKYKYINEINFIPRQNQNGEIELKLSINKSKNEENEELEGDQKALLDKNEPNYLIKCKLGHYQESKEITFLFDYSQHDYNSYKIIETIKNYCFKIKYSEKFLLYYEYLLITKDELKKENKYYISLINDFISEENKLNNKKDLLTMEMIISILIASLYENNFDSLKKLNISKKDDINLIDIRENNLINIYEDIYLKQILNCLKKINDNKPLSKNKNLILEIIIIYFVKFNKGQLKILFSSDDYKKMIIKLLKFKNSIFLGEILDEESTQIFINHSLNLENIINILNKNNNYIDYLTNIDKNFEKIYSFITSLTSIKELYQKFTIDYEVSQLDDLNRFAELHTSIFKKQNQKKKYIINFIKIFEKYLTLFEKSNNLSNICLLEKMIYEELNILGNSQKLKDINKNYKNKILNLLFNKDGVLNYFEDEKFFDILVKLKHHYNDNTFSKREKNIILQYFIEKCKNNNFILIKKFKSEKIFELFTKNDESKTLFKNVLNQTQFDAKNPFLDLFPDEDEYLDIKYNIIKKIIGNNKEDIIDDMNEEGNLIYQEMFNKNKDKFIEFLGKVNNIKFQVNIIIYLINNKDKNNEIEKNMINFIFDNIFDKKGFSFGKNKGTKFIPIYFLQKINNEKIKKDFIKSLQNKYSIDNDTIFSKIKNNKFLLLEQMIENNFFLYDYKTATIKFIKNIINDAYDVYKFKYNYKELIIIFDNYKKNYYKIIEIIFKEDGFQNEREYLEKLKKLKKDIEEVKGKIELLNKRKILDENYYKISKSKEIKDIGNIIKELEEGNLKLINEHKYQSFLYNMVIENKEIHLDFSISSFSYFKYLYEINKSANKENNQDEKALFNKTKKEIEELYNIIFNKNIEEKMKNPHMKKFMKYLDIDKEQKFDNDLFIQIKVLYNIFNEKEKADEDIQKLVDEIKLYKDYIKIEMFSSVLINILSIFKSKNNDIYKKIKNIFDEINTEKKYENLIEKKKFLNIDEEIDDYYNFFYLLDKYKELNINPLVWLKDKNVEYFYSLRKYILDSGENEHLTFEILKMENIKHFFDGLYEKDDSYIFETLKKKLKNKNNKDDNLSSKNIIYFLENYEHLKTIENVIKDEQIKTEENLNNILTSFFYIEYKNKNFEFELSSIKLKNNEENEEKIEIYKELIERAFHILSHTKGDEISIKWKLFIEIKYNLDNYINLLNNKRDNSNEEQKILKIENNELKLINLVNNEIVVLKGLKEEIDEYEKIKKNEKEILLQYYERNEYIRFFYHRQIIQLYNLINNNSNNNNLVKLKKFLSFIFDKDIIINNINHQAQETNFEDKLNCISNFLNQEININSEELYNKNLIIKNLEDHLYLHSITNNEDYGSICLEIFYEYTNNLPLYSNILIYDEETNEEEILAFFYRVIECKTKSLFVLIFKDEIKKNIPSKSKFLFDKIKAYISNKDNKSVLLIIYPEKNEQILENIEQYQPFPISKQNKDMEQNIKDKIEQNISIVLSDSCGLGKTAHIKSKINFDEEDYIMFPLGGYMNNNDIIEKLNEEIKKVRRNKYVIHIELYDSINPNILKDFLFKLLILKYYGYNDKLCNIDFTKVRIIIEIPNTYVDYLNKYKILKYIKQNKELKIKEKQAFLTNNEKVKFVANVLKIYNNDEIMGKNILINNRNNNKNEYINLVEMTPDELDNLINKALIDNIKNIKNLKNYHPNFYQKNIFVNFLYSEFKKFIECDNLNPALIGYYNEIGEIRKEIIKSLIENSIYFTFTQFDKIINKESNKLLKFEKRNNNAYYENDEDKKKFDKIIEALEKKEKNHIIDYNNIKPSIVAFHEESLYFSVITSNKEDKKFNNIKNYLNIVNMQSKLYYSNRRIDLNIEYQEMKIIKTPKELEKDGKLLDELLNIIITDEKIIKKIKEIIRNNKTLQSYVFTNDNFVKMYLLIMRIRANIPTIIMGETGCGKTKLLQMFSFLYNFAQEYFIDKENAEKMNNFSNYIWMLRFHSGTTEDDIINFIQKLNKEIKNKEESELKNIENKWNSEYNNKLEEYRNKNWFKRLFSSSPKKNKFESGKKNEKKNFSKKFNFENRKIIIVFDEINTCNCLGFVKQILFDETIKAKYKIPKRYIFICTCNPYRFLNKENQNLIFGLNLNSEKKRKLIYTVNPLPFSLLNFVLDFQDLTTETTEKYIERMITENIEDNEHFKIIRDLLIISHKFLKDKGDITSVSLREINRFAKIYHFFKFYLIDRNTNDNTLNLSQNDIIRDTIILSLFFCYYLKLPTKKLKDDYIEQIKSKANYNYEETFERESNFIADKVLNNEKGYAKNIALKRNLFCEFICIINKEPLIIIGKPGSSKSLSINLLINAVNRNYSKNDLFLNNYEEIIPLFYQCSQTSTASGVQNLFESAKNKLKKEEYKNKYVLILMDEMGIADTSKNNPLKVLHTELDINSETPKEKFAFIGISNYSLDMSKMNRTYNIVVEELNEDNTYETGIEIANSIKGNLNDFSKLIIKIISKCYFYYINDYQPEKGQIQNFHGNRDFYSLIKYIFNNNILAQNKAKTFEIIFEGIYMNFGGQEKSFDVFKKNFDKFYKEETKQQLEFIPPKYDIVKCINYNINSSIDSRYLLLITKNEISENILKEILKSKNKKYAIISGEDFDNLESIDIINILLKIQIYMEQEIVLILKNLEIIYPSLYELFNKSFTTYLGNDKKYTKISYENKQTLVYVNDKFRVIILVDEKKLNKEDRPFLNRFEKHFLNFDKLLDKKEKYISKDIYNFLKNIIPFINKNYLNNHFILDNLDNIRFYLFQIIYDAKNILAEDDIKEKLMSKLAPLLTQEMFYSLKDREIDGCQSVYLKKFYKDNYNYNYNFKSFLSNLNEDNKVNVIYTFKQKNFFNANDFSRLFILNNTIILDLENKNKSIIEDVNKFLENNEKNLLIINLNEDLNQIEKNLLNKISKIINEYLINLETKNDKHFIFIEYKERNKYNNSNKNIGNNIIQNEIIDDNEEKNSNINIFINYNQQFIDNLFYEYNELDTQILIGSKYEIIYNENSLFKIIDKVFEELSIREYNENIYNLEGINEIKNKLKNNKIILDLIKEKLKKKFEIESKYIYSEIISEKIKIEEKENFVSKFYKTSFSYLIKLLKNLINYLEQDLFLSSELFSTSVKSKNEMEADFRSRLNNFNDKKEYNGIKNIYFGFESGLFHVIESINKKCNEIINEKNNKELIENELVNDCKLKNFLKEKYLILYKDYLLYFILIELKIKIKNSESKKIIIEFLDEILKKGFIMNYYDINKDKDKNKNANIKNFARTVIFLQTNKELISCILLIYLDFIRIIPDFQLEQSETRNKENVYLSQLVEEFIGNISCKGKFNYYFDQNKNQYIELLKNNLELFKIIGNKTDNSLYIQEIETFLDLIKNDSTNLLSFILKNNESLIEWKNYLTISNKLIKKFEDGKDNEKKLEILQIYLTDKSLLKYSLSFWKIILKEGNYFSFDKANEQFLNNDNSSLESKISESLNNNELLKEILLYYFEMYHENYYFEKIAKKNFSSDKDKYSELLGKVSLEHISNAFEFYEDKYRDNITILKLLNIIGYIKAYFKHFANIIYKCENKPEFFDFNSIDEKLHLSTISDNYMKNVKIYIAELIFIECRNRDDELYNFIKNKDIKYLQFIGEKFSEQINELKNNTVQNYFRIIYEIPSFKLIKEKLNEKNKVLNWLLDNKEKIYKLNKLYSINSIANKMIEHLKYRQTKSYIEKTKLGEEKAILNYDEGKMKKYIDSYNSILEILDKKDKKINISKNENCSLDYFVVDDKSENNYLYNIYEQLIKYQNEFIDIIYDNFDTYKNDIEEIRKNEIRIQEANEKDIINFTEEKFLDIIINSSFVDFSLDEKIIFEKTDLNLDMIEKNIIEEIIPGIKKFICGKSAIRKIIYKDDINNELSDEMLNEILCDFEKKITSQIINDEQKKNIIENIKSLDKNKILLSLQYLMFYILSNEIKEDENINDLLDKDDINDNIKYLKSLFPKSNDGDDDPYNEDNQNEEFKVRHLLSIYKLIVLII